MKRKLLLASSFSALALVVALIVVFLNAGPETSVPGTSLGDHAGLDLAGEAGENGGLGGGGPAGATAGEGEETEPAAGENEVATGARLYGQITDLREQPIPGGRVLLHSRFDFWSVGEAERIRLLVDRALGKVKSAPDRIAAETRADEEGRYEFAISSIPRGQYQVLAVASGMAPGSESWTWRPQTTRIDFRLGAGQVIEGTVVAPDGRPVPGASVRASEEDDDGRSSGFGFGRGGRRGPSLGNRRALVDEATTDGAGRFRLQVGDRTYHLLGDAEGFAAAVRRRVPAGTLDAVIALGPGRNIEGIVKDGKGNAVAGADVALYLDDRYGDDDRGAWGGGFGRGGFGRGGFSRGGFTPTLLMRRVLQPEEARVRADESGRFRFPDLGPGEYEVVASAERFAPDAKSVTLPSESETDVPPVELELSPGRRIRGRVSGPHGSPVAGALVMVGQVNARDREMSARRREEFLGRMIAEGRVEDAARIEKMIASREERRKREPVSIREARRAAETGADGRFSIDSLSPGTYLLSVEADDFTTGREEEIQLEEKDQEVSVVLDPGLRITGKVVSSVDDTPVPGAEVLLRQDRQARPLEVDAGGRFRAGGMRPGDRWTLFVDADGYSVATAEIEVAEDAGDQDVEVRLDPSASLSGKVVDAAGQPVRSATVRIEEVVEQPSSGAPGGGAGAEQSAEERRRQFMERFRRMRERRVRSVSARSDAAGSFTLKEINPSTSLELRVSHPDYREWTSDPIAIAPGEKLEGFEARLAFGARLVLDITDDGGRPVPGARVRLDAVLKREQAQGAGSAEGGRGRGRGGPSFGRFGMLGRGDPRSRTVWARSDASGRAKVSGVEAGLYSASLEQSGYQPWRSAISLVEDEVVEQTISLLPERTITGVVVDTMGAAVEGARVQARETDEALKAAAAEAPEGVELRRHDEWARGGPDGRFRIGDLGPGPYDLMAWGRGVAPGRLEGVRVQTDVNFVLERLGSISGWVATLESGTFVETFTIQARRTGGVESEPRRGPGGGGGRSRRFNDPQGRFQLDDLSPGRYELEVFSPGLSTEVVTVTVGDGEAVEGVEVRLYEGLSISGEVVSAKGRGPVAGAEIFLLALQAAAQEESSRPARGRFGFGGRGPGGDRGRGGAGGDRGRGAQRRPSSRSREQSLAEARSAIEAAKGMRPVLTSDETGAFRLQNLEPGSYRLLVTHPEFLPYAETIQVRDDRPIPARAIRLDEGLTLTGRIRRADHSTAAGSTLVFLGQDGQTRRTVVGADGRYRLGGFAAGSYSLRVTEDGRSVGQPVSVKIKNGSNRFDYQIPKGN